MGRRHAVAGSVFGCALVATCLSGCAFVSPRSCGVIAACATPYHATTTYTPTATPSPGFDPGSDLLTDMETSLSETVGPLTWNRSGEGAHAQGSTAGCTWAGPSRTGRSSAQHGVMSQHPRVRQTADGVLARHGFGATTEYSYNGQQSLTAKNSDGATFRLFSLDEITIGVDVPRPWADCAH